ncbi:6276_t:CDS:2 [Scutellospora calospora]|uniref:6276_t:CDS:1 n=1 Tax=Scutellospora calospora TaxID=85575 RepID=A0ACA9K0B8_9GLOM|nr:6276_t:CDS:2 [Scutellospora calospora]
MIYNLATSDQLEFSYLYLFKEDWHVSIADECKKSPTVRRVVEIVIQNPNLHKEMLADYKIPNSDD